MSFLENTTDRQALTSHMEPDEGQAFEIDTPPSGWPIWLTAVVVASLWALGPVAFAVGYRNGVAPLQDDGFALLVFSLLAIGPAALVFAVAYVVQQARKLGHEAHRAKAMADEMLAPALLAAARAGDVTLAIRDEIQRTAATTDDARETLISMRDALAFETDKLAGATAQSVRTAQELATTLGRERSEMTGLAQTLDSQATRVSDAIGQQAKMVAHATTVAETQIREAETGLSARAADLAAAAATASDMARVAGEDLTRHIARLESAGAGVASQVSAVESGLSQHRLSLVALSQALKADQEALAADTGDHAVALEAFIVTAQETAQTLGQQADAGSEAVGRMLADAALQLGDLVETARAERQEFSQSTLHSLEAVSQAAVEHRRQIEVETQAAIKALSLATEQSRTTTAEHAIRAREQVEQLSEAAFMAGQKANQVFETRLEEARALVGESSRMVEATGEATAARLASSVEVARENLNQLAAMLGDLEARVLRLPALVEAQNEQIRAASVRRIDQPQAVTDGDVDPASPSRADPAGVVPEDEPLELSTSAQISGADLAGRLGLRSRIRLTPIASDKEFSAVFEAAGGGVGSAEAHDVDLDSGEGDTWTWKDLLASLDGAGGEGERLESLVASDLEQMGVDPKVLLPTARIYEVATTLEAGDLGGARELVRNLAPAATRRIARRMFTDDDVRRRAELYIRRYRTLTDDAISRDAGAAQLAELLASDGGRMFLLLDAAAGDML